LAGREAAKAVAAGRISEKGETELGKQD
jgi:hypothetical protein